MACFVKWVYKPMHHFPKMRQGVKYGDVAGRSCHLLPVIPIMCGKTSPAVTVFRGSLLHIIGIICSKFSRYVRHLVGFYCT